MIAAAGVALLLGAAVVAAADGLSPVQASVAIALALIGGPLTAWVTTRGAARKAEQARVASERVEASVGPQNGHGTVQDATGEILGRLDSMHTTLESVVGAASLVSQRLKAHDRELSAHGTELARLGEQAGELERTRERLDELLAMAHRALGGSGG